MVVVRFHLGQLSSGGVWGWLTDRYGRRSCLLFGATGGALNGNIGITKYSKSTSACSTLVLMNGGVAWAGCERDRTYMGELTTKSTQSRAFGMLTFGWSLSSSIAPSIGGFLADPATFSEAFNTSFWLQFPYLLPCLFCVAVSSTCFVLALISLPESPVWAVTHAERHRTKADIHVDTLHQPEPSVDSDAAAGAGADAPATTSVSVSSSTPTSNSSNERAALLSPAATQRTNCCVRRVICLPRPVRSMYVRLLPIINITRR